MALAPAAGLRAGIMAHHPVFYDASGRRRIRFAGGVAAFAALIALAAAVFARAREAMDASAAGPDGTG